MQKSKRKACVAPSICLAVFLASAGFALSPQSPDRDTKTGGFEDTKDALLQLLGDSIAFKKDGSRYLVEYCPDNTCELFVANDTELADVSDLHDFAYLYLSFISGYYALEEFKALGREHARALLSKHDSSCPTSDVLSRAKCVLRRLARKSGIEVRFARYDEGQKHEEVLPLEVELRE